MLRVADVDAKRAPFLAEVRRLCLEQFYLSLDGADDDTLDAAIVQGMGPGKHSALGIAMRIHHGDLMIPGVHEELEPDYQPDAEHLRRLRQQRGD